MQIPQVLRDMIDDGLIQDVIRPLKSGKEASVFVVLADNRYCAAKVYKDAERRTFRHRQDYVEGRQVGDSRQQRAMSRGSRFGKKQSEAAWQSMEATVLSRLHAAGVRVPQVLSGGDGVLVMELVCDRDGNPANQIVHTHFTAQEALRTHGIIIQEIARMLCAGYVHGDLSEFNILMAPDGPVIIDVPQAVDAASNNNAKRMLLRDVENVTRFFAKYAPVVRRGEFGQEMWHLYQNTNLRPDTKLTGYFKNATKVVDAHIILREVQAAKEEAAKREEIRRLRQDQSKHKNQPRR
jgi:RIO kinase 1